MNKKIFAIIVSMAVVFSAVLTCFAADGDDAWKNNTGTIKLDTLEASGEGISVSGNVVSITKGGDFEVTGTLADGMIYIKSDEKVKLRLSGMSITNSSGPAIFFDNADKGFITITENTENFLNDGAEYTVEDADAALFSNDDLEIKGSGALTVTGNYQHGIAGDDDVTIENGNIIIKSYEHGIKANDTLSVTGGNIEITSKTGKGMKADLEVIIDDGNINIESLESEGIESKGTLTVNGGNISIWAYDDGLNTGNADSDEDINNMMPQEGTNFGGDRVMGDMGGKAFGGKKGEMPTDTNFTPPATGGEMQQFTEREEQMIPGGQMPQEHQTTPGGGGHMGFGMVDEETAAAHALTINGGTIYINANGDGIDSNGNLTINGGTITIDGPTNAGNGPLDSDGTMSINGGSVLLVSSMGMVQLPRDNEGQNILSVTFSQRQSADTEIIIKEAESGEVVTSHTSEKEFQSFVYTSDNIESGKEYKIFVNGSEYMSITATDEATFMGSGNGGFAGGGRNHFGGGRENQSGQQIKVTIDGADINFDTSPVIKEGTTLVGFRAILEALGATVGWDEETKTVTAEKDGITITLQIGSTSAKVNGEEKTLLLAPEIINNSTMIPVRFVSEELNMNVDWDGNTKLIKVTSK